MKTVARVGFILCGLFALFWIWYSIAANYDYQALSGTYMIVRSGETCTLRLNADGSFSEILAHPNRVETASSGKWRRFGEATVEFSPSFVMLSGQKRSPAGGIYGHFQKTLMLFPSLVLDSAKDRLRLRRRLN